MECRRNVLLMLLPMLLYIHTGSGAETCDKNAAAACIQQLQQMIDYGVYVISSPFCGSIEGFITSVDFCLTTAIAGCAEEDKTIYTDSLNDAKDRFETVKDTCKLLEEPECTDYDNRLTKIQTECLTNPSVVVDGGEGGSTTINGFCSNINRTAHCMDNEAADCEPLHSVSGLMTQAYEAMMPLYGCSITIDGKTIGGDTECSLLEMMNCYRYLFGQLGITLPVMDGDTDLQTAFVGLDIEEWSGDQVTGACVLLNNIDMSITQQCMSDYFTKCKPMFDALTEMASGMMGGMMGGGPPQGGNEGRHSGQITFDPMMAPPDQLPEEGGQQGGDGGMMGGMETMFSPDMFDRQKEYLNAMCTTECADYMDKETEMDTTCFADAGPVMGQIAELFSKYAADQDTSTECTMLQAKLDCMTNIAGECELLEMSMSTKLEQQIPGMSAAETVCGTDITRNLAKEHTNCEHKEKKSMEIDQCMRIAWNITVPQEQESFCSILQNQLLCVISVVMGGQCNDMWTEHIDHNINAWSLPAHMGGCQINVHGMDGMMKPVGTGCNLDTALDCYSDFFTAIGVGKDQNDAYDHVDAQKWMNASSLVYHQRDEYCPSLKDLDYNTMAECAEDVFKTCKYPVQISYDRPNTTPKGSKNPFDISFIQHFVDVICDDDCADLPTKVEKAEECTGLDTTKTPNGMPGLVSEIAANKHAEKDNKVACGALEKVNDCWKDNGQSCPYLKTVIEMKSDQYNITQAMGTCQLELFKEKDDGTNSTAAMLPVPILLLVASFLSYKL